MFLGIHSQSANLPALAIAQQQIQNGESPEPIRQRTGWLQGVDGHWRYEISDHQAGLKKPFPENGGLLGGIYASVYKQRLEQGQLGLTVGDVLDHPALFKAYPELAAISVTTRPGGASSYRPRTAIDPRVIEIGNEVPMYSVGGVLLHELQHVVQEIEGFAKGGSVQSIEKAWQDRSAEQAQFNRALEQWGATNDPVARDNANQQMAYYAKRLEESAYLRAATSAAEAYSRLVGEVEARNVQTRQSLSEAKRLAMSPGQTADVEPGAQIVIGHRQPPPIPQSMPTPSSRSVSAMTDPYQQRADQLGRAFAQMGQAQVNELKGIAPTPCSNESDSLALNKAKMQERPAVRAENSGSPEEPAQRGQSTDGAGSGSHANAIDAQKQTPSPHPLPPKGLHIGPLTEVNDDWIAQDIGRGNIVRHPRHLFPGRLPLGTSVDIDTRTQSPTLVISQRAKGQQQGNER